MSNLTYSRNATPSSIASMKLSVSVPRDSIEYLDQLALSGRFSSRSAAIQAAIRLLRAHDLGDEYEAAWVEWADSGEAAVWDATVGDGLSRSQE